MSPTPTGVGSVLASWLIEPGVAAHPAEEVGGKASGLLQLPRAWTPDFVVLTSTATPSNMMEDNTLGLDTKGTALVDELIRKARLAKSVLLGCPAIYVRSNAVDEDLSARGKYQSLAVEPTLEAISNAARTIIQQAPDEMRVLLQVAAEGVGGFMSNEHRVTPSSDLGVVEGLQTEPSRLRSRRPANASRSLWARSRAEVRTVLADVLAWHRQRSPNRILVEWVWDGQRVWIVQYDQVPVPKSEDAAAAYLGSSQVPPSLAGKFSVDGVVPFRDVAGDVWRKLHKAHHFAQLGLQTPDIYVVSGVDWGRPEVRRNVRQLLSHPRREWVARTDIASTANIEEDLLPTSAPWADGERLTLEMASMAETFVAEGVPPDKWAFLLAPLIPTRATAMAYATPDRMDVQLDCLWGFPDGLMYLPHDTYLCDPEAKRIKAHSRYKPACLLFRDGAWRTMRLGPPYDWRRVLSDAEILTIARWAHLLARDLGQPVKLMALAQVGGRRGPAHCLPFHYTVGAVAPPDRRTFPARAAGVVRDREDLERLRAGDAPPGIFLQPRDSYGRDSDFLCEVASFASERGIPILFDGSLLGHAYHIMNKAGATVVPRDPTPVSGSEQAYNKLVRDAIPAIIERSGSVARVRTLSPDQALPLLKRKLVEEALEALHAAGSDLVEELADLREVLDAIQQHVAGGVGAVDAAMAMKREGRGAFSDLVFLESTAVLPVDAPATVPGGRSTPTRRRPLSASPIVEEVESDGVALTRVVLNLPLIPDNDASDTSNRTPFGPGWDVEVVRRYSKTALRVEVCVTPLQDALQQPLFDIDRPVNQPK